MTRAKLLKAIADRIIRLPNVATVRVAIDGVDAAGKTTLADQLAEQLRALGRPVIRASIDSFHNPRHIRHGRGLESPEGYYRDSFDLKGLTTALLEPLGPGGSSYYRTALFDYRSDTAVEQPVHGAEPSSILLFDGVFLLQPELRRYWDYSIFAKADFSVTLARAMTRDVVLFGNADTTRQRYQARYIPGQKMYLDECQPELNADLVLDNNDPANVFILAERLPDHR